MSSQAWGKIKKKFFFGQWKSRDKRLSNRGQLGSTNGIAIMIMVMNQKWILFWR